MRNLTVKQKNLLRKWFKEHEPSKDEAMIFGKGNTLESGDDLTNEQWETLEKINDTEILYQNVEVFINDLRNGKDG